MRTGWLVAFLPLLGFACSAESRTDAAVAPDGGAEAPAFGADASAAACEGLECAKPACADGATTAIEGEVYDPAGKATVYNVRVYVPNAEPDAFPEGVQSCDRCAAPLTGKPVAVTLTDERGHFRIEGVPAGERVPLVAQIGKFRRKIVVPRVEPCKTTKLADGALSLPRTRGEGDLPRIAVVTGGYDELGCVLRRIGLDDAEFGPPGSKASVHVYKGQGGGGVTGGTAKSASELWSDVDTLKQYDAVLLACEGDEAEADKTPAAKKALYDYVAAGGRVFATHYHYTWIKGSPEADVRGVASWNPPASAYGTEDDLVDTSFPKGAAMAAWLKENGASKTAGSIAIENPARNVAKVTPEVAQRWIYASDEQVRYFSFNVPVGAPAAQQCGRVAFTDIHSRERLGAFTLPGGCDPSDMTPQERALEFLLFDLSACVQPDADKPAPPPIK
ncbi:MAG: carboxypeptidase regulatory-like domain-containing protein [Myxococcales bacterium]|nr:carboxypeptidase regulatory-like domain-containing protein [Myxococcales bacterium]